MKVLRQPHRWPSRLPAPMLALSLAACSARRRRHDRRARQLQHAAPATESEHRDDAADRAVRPRLRGCPGRRRRQLRRHGQEPGRHRRLGTTRCCRRWSPPSARPASVDTLNSAEDITVFAPTNDAFDAMDQATLDKAMGDPKGLLTKVLTYHVVEGKIAPDELAGTHKSLQGGEVTVEGSGEDFTVDGNATVVCGNVQTANATVYIIDQVLMPTPDDPQHGTRPRSSRPGPGARPAGRRTVRRVRIRPERLSGARRPVLGALAGLLAGRRPRWLPPELAAALVQAPGLHRGRGRRQRCRRRPRAWLKELAIRRVRHQRQARGAYRIVGSWSLLSLASPGVPGGAGVGVAASSCALVGAVAAAAPPARRTPAARRRCPPWSARRRLVRCCRSPAPRAERPERVEASPPAGSRSSDRAVAGRGAARRRRARRACSPPASAGRGARAARRRSPRPRQRGRRRPRRRRLRRSRASPRSSRRTTTSTGSTPRCRCPQVDPDDWTLRIDGHGRPASSTLTFDDLLAPADLVEATSRCLRVERGRRRPGRQRPLARACRSATLLDEAGVDARRRQVLSARSVDGFTAGFPSTPPLDGRDALVAVGMNGEPLPSSTASRPAWSCPACTATCRRRSG